MKRVWVREITLSDGSIADQWYEPSLWNRITNTLAVWDYNYGDDVWIAYIIVAFGFVLMCIVAAGVLPRYR